MIDPFILSTAATGGMAIYLYIRADIFRAKSEHWKKRTEQQLDRIVSLIDQRDDAQDELARLKDGQRRGGYASGRKRREEIAERKSATGNALFCAPLRPRDQVVADIQASRAAKKSGAVVAAKEGG